MLFIVDIESPPVTQDASADFDRDLLPLEGRGWLEIEEAARDLVDPHETQRCKDCERQPVGMDDEGDWWWVTVVVYGDANAVSVRLVCEGCSVEYTEGRRP